MVRRKVRITVCPGEGRRALVRRLRTVGFEQESDNLVFRQPPLASDLQVGVRLKTLPRLRKGGGDVESNEIPISKVRCLRQHCCINHRQHGTSKTFSSSQVLRSNGSMTSSSQRMAKLPVNKKLRRVVVRFSSSWVRQ